MLEYQTSGTLGDTYIICLKLLKLGNVPIKVYHRTSNFFWYTEIKSIYSLLPNVSVEFVKPKDPYNDSPIIEAGYKHIDTEFFPDFGFSDMSIEEPYYILQTHSGKPKEIGKNCKMLHKKWVQEIVDTYGIDNKHIILIGTDKEYSDVERCTNLVGELDILDCIRIVSQAEGFIGPEGLMSFVALSHKIKSYIFYTESKAVEERIISTPWEKYCRLEYIGN